MSSVEPVQANRPANAAVVVLRQIRAWEGVGLFVVLLLLYISLSVASPTFLTLDNQLNILQQAAFFGIVAFAMTLVIVAGEIDISVGSMAALSSSLLGVLVTNLGWPLWTAGIAVLSAATIGAFAGWMRATFGVPTFIAPSPCTSPYAVSRNC